MSKRPSRLSVTSGKAALNGGTKPGDNNNKDKNGGTSDAMRSKRPRRAAANVAPNYKDTEKEDGDGEEEEEEGEEDSWNKSGASTVVALQSSLERGGRGKRGRSRKSAAAMDPSDEVVEEPSEYELARSENIKRNAMFMASLGLGGTGGGKGKGGAAERAKRGLPSRQPKAYPARTRESARVRGKTPDGLSVEGVEAAALKRKQVGVEVVTADAVAVATAVVMQRRQARLLGDVSMAASMTEASADGPLRLQQIMGGLVGRDGMEGAVEDYDLDEPDETLQRLLTLTVQKSGVCKLVRERAYSLAWHPSNAKLLLAVGDKVGHVGLWTVDDDEENTDQTCGVNGRKEGAFEFKPHTGAVPRLAFDSRDGNKLISTSYDGTVRRMDVEKGAFEQVFASDVREGSFLTDSHLMAEERTILLSDAVGDVTAVDLRTSQQVWKREAHEKKVNTVHVHPTNRHLFATASLDRSVKIWDARNLGAGAGAGGVRGMKPLSERPHFRSVNSAHFSPLGEWLATVGQDDKILLYQDPAQSTGSQVLATHVLRHNNQTGRWLTKFQASWDPKSKGLFAIGSMQRGPHGIHLYSVTGSEKRPSAVAATGGDIMTSIQSVVAFHPARDVLAGVNSSGRVHIFS